MKPFVVNRYGRIVLPFNFFPALDFSIFDSLEQFAAVIRRDFEEKAPSSRVWVLQSMGSGLAMQQFQRRFDNVLMQDLTPLTMTPLTRDH